MPSFATVWFNMGYRNIKAAYLESRKGFEREAAEIEREWQEHKAAVAAGEIVEDNDDGWAFDAGDYYCDRAFENEEAIQVIKQAFVMAIYHYWERKARSLLGVTAHDLSKVFDAAEKDPRFEMDRKGLDRLRKIVNCIKHENGSKLSSEAPELFDPSILPEPTHQTGWHAALRLGDSDVSDAFRAVKASGPKSGPGRELPDEPDGEE